MWSLLFMMYFTFTISRLFPPIDEPLLPVRQQEFNHYWVFKILHSLVAIC